MDQQLLLDAFSRMTLIRLAEQKIADDFLQNKIFSFLHLSTGQEAVAVGVALAMQPKDLFFGNHRSHGHYLAKGGNLYEMFCEIYGRADGCCKGKGGSMHMLDRRVGFAGTTPILGSAVPIATGMAFAQKMRREPNVTCVFYGDGASEEGVVYESINLAAQKRLPILFILEDNLYAVNSPKSSRRSDRHSMEKIAQGLGAEYFKANGNRVESVYEAATVARRIAADYAAPAVIHATTFRHYAHSGPIFDESVRVTDTKEIRHAADCITSIMYSCKQRGIDERTLERMAGALDGMVNKAFDAAKQAEEPDAEERRSGIYA